MMDYYQELGVHRSATPNDIRTAYKRLALLWHPDRNKATDAEEKFKKIKQAYDILSDEQRRREYDQEQSQKNKSSTMNNMKYSSAQNGKDQINFFCLISFRVDLFNLHTFDNFMSMPIDPFDIINDIQFFQDSDFTSKMSQSPAYRQFYTQIFHSMNQDILNSSAPIFLKDDRLFRSNDKRSSSKYSPINPVSVIHSTMPNDWFLNQIIDLHEQQTSFPVYSPFEYDRFFDDLTHCIHCHRRISRNRTRLIEHENRCRKRLHNNPSKSVRV